MLNVIRSFIFYVVYAITMMATSTTAVILSPFVSRNVTTRLCVTWCRFAIWWGRVCCGMDYEIIGKENIPEGGCVVISKHQSAWETLMVQAEFYPAATVLKQELLWIPFFGWALRFFEPISINRKDKNNALKAVIRQGEEKVKQGRRVVIFPEGTRTLPGEPNPVYSSGGAMLATKTKSIVVPVAHNAGDCWPRGTMIKRPGKITVVIGQPINSADYSTKALSQMTQEWIEAEVARIRQAS